MSQASQFLRHDAVQLFCPKDTEAIEQVLQNYPYATIRADVGFVSDSRVRQRERERDIHVYIYIYIYIYI